MKTQRFSCIPIPPFTIIVSRKKYVKTQWFCRNLLLTNLISLAVNGAFGFYSEASGGRLASLAYTPASLALATPFRPKKIGAIENFFKKKSEKKFEKKIGKKFEK